MIHEAIDRGEGTSENPLLRDNRRQRDERSESLSQLGFAEAEYGAKKRQTQSEAFLERREALTPRAELEPRIAPHDVRGASGRPPDRLARDAAGAMSAAALQPEDPARDDALCEVESMRRLAGVTLERVPDETTILNFRHLLQRRDLGEVLFTAIHEHLARRGLLWRAGTIRDATIIAAPESTKNAAGARDPWMRPTRKGKKWHLGMKRHIGTDDALGLVYGVHTAPAHEANIDVADKRLHGDQRTMPADGRYQGLDRGAGHKGRSVAWHIALRPGRRAALVPDDPPALAEKVNARVRAKVEHPFRHIHAGVRRCQGTAPPLCDEREPAAPAGRACESADRQPVSGDLRPPCARRSRAAPKVQSNGRDEGALPSRARLSRRSDRTSRSTGQGLQRLPRPFCGLRLLASPTDFRRSILGSSSTCLKLRSVFKRSVADVFPKRHRASDALRFSTQNHSESYQHSKQKYGQDSHQPRQAQRITQARLINANAFLRQRELVDHNVEGVKLPEQAQ
jgi:IS5 family transposase